MAATEPWSRAPYLEARGPCDLACCWCNYRNVRWQADGREAERLMAEIDALASSGGRRIGFGVHHSEPTTLTDFPIVVRHAREAGFEEIHLATSGLRLADRAYLRELVAAGVTDVTLSFAGLDAELADLLLGSDGATAAKLTTLENLVAERVNASVLVMFLRPALRGTPDAVSELQARAGKARGLVAIRGCALRRSADVEPWRLELLWPRNEEILWTMEQLRLSSPRFELSCEDLPAGVVERIPGAFTAGASTPPDPQDAGESLLGVASAPPKPDIAALRAALLAGGMAPVAVAGTQNRWSDRIAGLLADVRARHRFIDGFEVGEVHLDGRRLTVRLESPAGPVEASIHRRDDAERSYLIGEALALSYRSTTPVDTSAKRRVLRTLLRLAERACGAASNEPKPTA